MVSDTGDKDENNLVGFAKSSAKDLVSPVEAKWEVVVDGIFSLLVNSSSALRILAHILIEGALGSSSYVNGVYLPSGVVANGKECYRMVDEGKQQWVVFGSNGKWMVAPSCEKAASDGTCWCHSIETGHQWPWECTTWTILNGGRWEVQAGLTCSRSE